MQFGQSLHWLHTQSIEIEKGSDKAGLLTTLISCESMVNSFHASSYFRCLLITFANSLDPDQDRQNVGPDLDPKCLTL